MKKAKISAVPAGQTGGFAWTWHCAADNASSKTTFPFYYACVIDAREHGYEVEPVFASGAMAPAGTTYSLDQERQ